MGPSNNIMAVVTPTIASGGTHEHLSPTSKWLLVLNFFVALIPLGVSFLVMFVPILHHVDGVDT